MRGGPRGLLAAIVGGFLALAGTTLIVIAINAHEPVPLPPSPAVGSDPPPSSSPAKSPASRIVGPVLSRSKPVAITIPAISVRSSLVSLGLNSDDTVQVPSGTAYDKAGWYRYSPTPGSVGPAIILGHVSGTAGASVFFNLGDLRPGDRVKVMRRDGVEAVFRVNGVWRYPKAKFPTKLVYGNITRRRCG